MKNNVLNLKSNLGRYTKICAVVKANAYGVGLEKVSKHLRNIVDYFAVARVYEAVKLRNYGIYSKILILSPIVDERQILLAIKYNTELTVNSLDELEKINRVAINAGEIAKVHLKVDSGMNRFGVKNLYEFKEILEVANSCYNISVVGLFSHFAVSDEDSMNNQIQEFEKYIRFCHKKRFYPLVHMASSKQVSNRKCSYDMVRIGLNLYDNDDILTFSGTILEVKELKKGEKLGYDQAFTANTSMTIACVDIGYADISVRKLSRTGQVLVNGKRCNIVGNVCMDCLFVDITDIDAHVGESVVLFGKQKENYISICEIAKGCDTINYDLLSSMSERVKRIYK